MRLTKSSTNQRENLTSWPDPDLTDSVSSKPVTGDCALSVRLAQHVQEVEDLRSFWELWSTGLETDIDYYLENLKNDRTILHPYVFSVWKGDTPQAILVAYVRARRASTIVSMVQVPGPEAKILEIVPAGRLGLPSRDVDKVLVAQLAKALRNDADLLGFRRLPIESAFFEEVWKMPGLLVGKRVVHVFSYSRLALTSPMGKKPAVFSGKIIREARRKNSNLLASFPNKVRFTCFSAVDDLDEGLRDAERVSETAWQHSLRVGLTDTIQTRDGYRFLAEKGWLRIYILYVKDIPCAYLLGQLRGDTFYCQRAGFHSDFGVFSVGSILTARAFECIAAEGAKEVDLGEGGQEHNRRLGCVKLDEGTVHVYAPTLRGVRLRVFFGTTHISRILGRHVRNYFGLDLVGRAFKHLLTARPAPSPSTALASAALRTRPEALATENKE
jgi:hypothetical protein